MYAITLNFTDVYLLHGYVTLKSNQLIKMRFSRSRDRHVIIMGSWSFSLCNELKEVSNWQFICDLERRMGYII